MKKNKIVILGGGESGIGTAILGKKEGFEVFVSDYGKIKKNINKFFYIMKLIGKKKLTQRLKF